MRSKHLTQASTVCLHKVSDSDGMLWVFSSVEASLDDSENVGYVFCDSSALEELAQSIVLGDILLT